jgi:signal transduction histidine kinase
MKRTRKARPSESIGAPDALQERVKELSCLYAVSQIIVDGELTRDERLRRIVQVLPRAWRFPSFARARIVLDGAALESDDFEPVAVSHSADIMLEGARRGAIEVGYTAVPSAAGAAPFLEEEEHLIQNIARQVSLFLTREADAARRGALEHQLRHADRLATIGQLAAGVAHEMNEPLSSILGLAQLALKAPGVPSSVADDLSEIVTASLRAREIVKKLLLFARQTPPRKTAVNLNDVVEDALFLLEAGCERQGIALHRRLAPDLPTIDADPLQIRQVLVNLVVNATQAIAAEGSVTVETRIEGPFAVMSVVDTGHGMSPETLSRIFGPFFTTKDVGEGTGLGLSVVHGIVTAHNGTIEAESRENHGSRFTVRLPIAEFTPPMQG